MNVVRTYKLKRILGVAFWVAMGIALFVLLLSAMQRNSTMACKGTAIVIEGYNNEMFINDADVKSMLENELNQKLIGTALEKINLRKLEQSLQTNPWISKAQLFVDNQQCLHVNIAERMPVARVFTRSGKSFYLDSSAVALPLSVNEIADVPVFSNVPDATPKMIVQDSLAWRQISSMGNFIVKDSFLLMQIGQVELTENLGYKMYPAIGNHTILFGTADGYQSKLHRLGTFYKKVFGKVGLNKYEVIDLRYDKQIVATLRGKQGANIDAAATMKKFEELVNRTVNEANDTSMTASVTHNEPLRQEIIKTTSLQPDDDSVQTIKVAPTNVLPNKIVSKQTAPQKEKPAVTPIKLTPKQNKPTVITQKQQPMIKDKQVKSVKPKPEVKKPQQPVVQHTQPKAVMPKQNDY